MTTTGRVMARSDVENNVDPEDRVHGAVVTDPDVPAYDGTEVRTTTPPDTGMVRVAWDDADVLWEYEEDLIPEVQ